MSQDEKEKSKKWIIYIALVTGVIFVFLAGLVMGVIGGLVYAWVVNPPECVDCLPAQLTEPYKGIYIGLVVDSYALDRNMDEVKAWLGTMEEAEIIQTLSEHYECALSQDDHARADLIREMLLIYHRP